MFNDRLKSCRELCGITQVELAEKIGVSKDLYNKYERTETRPNFETLRKIAIALNVSTDYLLGLTDFKNIDDQLLINKSNMDKYFDALSPASQDWILKIFHSLTECVADYEALHSEQYTDIEPGYGKYLMDTISQFIKAYQDAAIYLKKHLKLHDVIHKYEETHQFADKTSDFFEHLVWELQGRLESIAKDPGNIIRINVRRLPLYAVGASAGTGNPLDDSPYDIVEVGPEAPLQTSFLLKADGDSMEPLIHDGETLYIKQQGYVEDGEIGIFWYDGDVFVKRQEHRCGAVYLISVNPNYRPIKVSDDSIHCFGKVLNK